MSDHLTQQLLDEIRELRNDVKELRNVLDADTDSYDTLEQYDNPEEILQALNDAQEEFGPPHV